MEVIDTMKIGGNSTGAMVAVFDDCYHGACDLWLILNIVMGKLIRWLVRLLGWLDLIFLVVDWTNQLEKLPFCLFLNLSWTKKTK